MKRVRVGVVGILLCSLTSGYSQDEPLSLDGQTGQACTENLIRDPSFEEGIGEWQIAHGEPTWMAVDREVAHTGEASLRLNPPPGTDPVFVQVGNIPVDPWVPYRLRFFYRSAVPRIGPMWRIFPVDMSGGQTAGRSAFSTLDGSDEWTACFADYVFPSDVAAVQIAFAGGSWKPGWDRNAAFWVDDVEFGPATALELEDASLVSPDSIVFNGGFELAFGDQPFGWSGLFNVEAGTCWAGPLGVGPPCARGNHYMGRRRVPGRPLRAD